MENTQTVTNVSIEWLMKNVIRSIDGFTACLCEDGYTDCDSGFCPSAVCDSQGMDSQVMWDELIENKAHEFSPAFIESVMQDGVKSPICLVYGEGRGFMHGNGHHRTALAILLAMDTIPVVFSFGGDYMLSAFTGEYAPKSYSDNGTW